MNNVPLGNGGVRGRFRYDPKPVPASGIVGLAADFSVNQLPINGLRHPCEGGSSGWYIYSGEDFPEVFEPTHVGHVIDLLPEIAAYLELPPGWRFLIAPGYDDVWEDDSLLEI